MAGIGGYPQVIQLPKDTRWADLGEGLGKFAGSIFDAWNTADAMQKAQQIPDLDHKMVYLRSRLGDKSDKYIDDQIKLMTLRDSTAKTQAENMRWQAQMHRWDIQNHLDDIKAQNEDALLKADIAAKEHRANATRSGAAGSSAKANQQNASAAHSEAEAEQIRAKMKRDEENSKALQEYFHRTQPQPALPPSPQPQSYTVPQGGTNGSPSLTGGATVKPIVAGDVVAPPAPQGVQTIDTTGPVGTMSDLPGATKPGEAPKDLTLDQMESLRKYATSGTQLMVPVPGITEETIQQAITEAGEGKAGDAWKAIKAAKKPADIKLENIGGGFQAYTGLYEDGQRHIVPGSRVEDKRTKMDVQEQRAEQNVGLWQASNRIMRELSAQPAASGTGIGAEFLNSALGRAASAWLYRNTGQALTPNAPRYLAQYALARTSLDSMMAGLRETDRYRQLLDTTQPGYADSPSVKRAKFDTMEMTADLMIKARMEDALRNGKQYGAQMAELYKSRGLDKMSVDDIVAKYQEGSRATPDKATPAPSSTPRSGSRLRPLGDTGVSIEVEP